MSLSPWGSVQERKVYAPGIGSVSTAGHGGFYITQHAAVERRLPTACTSRGINQGGFYWFEEDCDWAILAILLPELWNQMFEHCTSESTAYIKADPRKYLVETLSRWNADYLLEIGVQPDPAGLLYFNERKLDAKMRKEKHPDLIVCAYGDWHEGCPKGAVEVITADGVQHFVTAESYAKRTELNLLSKCVLFKAEVECVA